MIYPPDIETQHERWGANCGPCAVAAILNRPVMAVREFFPHFPARPWNNITQIRAAIEQANFRAVDSGRTRPGHGLLFIQWGGHAHKPDRVQYRFTHWIAIDGDLVFEVNAPRLVTWQEWIEVMPDIAREEKRGDGSFFIRAGLCILPGLPDHIRRGKLDAGFAITSGNNRR